MKESRPAEGSRAGRKEGGTGGEWGGRHTLTPPIPAAGLLSSFPTTRRRASAWGRNATPTQTITTTAASQRPLQQGARGGRAGGWARGAGLMGCPPNSPTVWSCHHGGGGWGWRWGWPRRGEGGRPAGGEKKYQARGRWRTSGGGGRQSELRGRRGGEGQGACPLVSVAVRDWPPTLRNGPPRLLST